MLYRKAGAVISLHYLNTQTSLATEFSIFDGLDGCLLVLKNLKKLKLCRLESPEYFGNQNEL